MENNQAFNPLAWAAASNKNNAATDNGQSMTNLVDNLQSGGAAHKRAADNADAKAELMGLINELLKRGINITESYHDWIRVGFALAEELGAEGRDAFHQLSAMSSKYDPRECEAKWHSLLHANSGRVKGNTLFWLAQQAGVDTTSI